MREIHPAPPHRELAERVFYTIREADLGKSNIATTAGNIFVGEMIGRVKMIDVGKRLYFTPHNSYPGGGLWYLESTDQHGDRLANEVRRGHRK